MSLMSTWGYGTTADGAATAIAKLHAIGLDSEADAIARYVQALEQQVAGAVNQHAEVRRWKYACCATIVFCLTTIAFVIVGTMA